MKNFVLCGLENQFRGNIIAEECILTSLREDNNFVNNTINVKATFSAYSVILFPEALQTKPDHEIYFHAKVLNMHETMNVVVKTEIGDLLIGHCSGIKNLEIMRTLDIPLLTSFVQLSIIPNGLETLKEIVNKVIERIQDFLKVTSLCQMVWHDWSFLGAYERSKDTEQGKLIFMKISTPKAKIPISSPLAPIAYSSDFINAA